MKGDCKDDDEQKAQGILNYKDFYIFNFSSLGPPTDENESPLKKAYSERVGVPVTSLRFLLDGRRITDSEPVSALVKEMEANDVIEVYQEQYGGYL